jgi:ABC-type oligopeptide transport system substrate-binding subunit
MAMALGVGCHAKQAPHPSSLEERATLRRVVGGEPGILDPGAAADSFSLEVLGDLYEGLTAEAADETVVPAVADSWSVDPAGTRFEIPLAARCRLVEWCTSARPRLCQFVAAGG